MKTTGELLEQVKATARRLWLPAILIVVAFLINSYRVTDIRAKLGINPGTIPVAGMIALLVVGYFLRIGRYGWAFVMTSITISFSLVTMFRILYPDLMVSSLDPAWNLTIYNASSSPYTLTVMSVIAAVFVPVVLLYQGWSYWIFRKRVESQPEALTY